MGVRHWVWTKAPITFHDNEKKEWFEVPAWTKGYLVKPDAHQRERLESIKRQSGVRHFVVNLAGDWRYISSAVLLTEPEWEARREMLRKEGVAVPDDTSDA
jgi:hypothetical protein